MVKPGGVTMPSDGSESWFPNATEPALACWSNGGGGGAGGGWRFCSDSCFKKELATACSCHAKAVLLPGSPSQGLSMERSRPSHFHPIQDSSNRSSLMQTSHWAGQDFQVHTAA